jgi:L-fuculose-phosphate aldolase
MTDLRQSVIDAARTSVVLGLTHGTSGNVSARVDGGFAITPTGRAYDQLEAADVVIVDDKGHPLDGSGTPSSEWRMHAAVYRGRPEVGAVVHSHSPKATALACLGRDLPAFHYMIAVAGGDSVRCARYATFGTEELGTLAAAAMTDRWACLLAHHGLLAAGRSLDHALAVAEEVEFLSGVYLYLLPFGEPAVLGPAAMQEVLARFERYRRNEPL